VALAPAPAPTAVSRSESLGALPIWVAPENNTPIRIKVRRGAMTLSMQWPRSAISSFLTCQSQSRVYDRPETPNQTEPNCIQGKAICDER
jgi:hypothetical protein